jgi:hypothetical protein
MNDDETERLEFIIKKTMEVVSLISSFEETYKVKLFDMFITSMQNAHVTRKNMIKYFYNTKNTENYK